jgi:hypothetical protein
MFCHILWRLNRKVDPFSDYHEISSACYCCRTKKNRFIELRKDASESMNDYWTVPFAIHQSPEPKLTKGLG